MKDATVSSPVVARSPGDIATVGEERRAAAVSVNQEGRLVLDWMAAMRRQPRRAFPVPLALSLEGPVRVQAVETAINQVVARHAALRTSFPDVTRLAPSQERRILEALSARSGLSEPLFVQTVHPEVRIELTHRVADAATQLGHLHESPDVCNEISRPFDYDRPPLMRASLIRLDRLHHVLLVVFDHMVVDAWSLTIFKDDFAAAYTAGHLATPAAGSDYADYASRERDRLRVVGAAPSFRDAVRQWQQWDTLQLRRDELPYSEDPCPSGEGLAASARSDYDAALVGMIRGFCRSQQITTYMLFLAALSLVGQSYRRRDDVAFWGMSANRDRDNQAVVGWCAGDRLLATRGDGQASVSAWTRELRGLVVAANASDHIPRALLQLTADPGPASGRTVEMSLDMESGGMTRPVRLSEGLSIARMYAPNLLGPGVIRLWVTEGTSSLFVRASYSKDAGSERGIAAMLTDVKGAIVDIVSDPHRRVGAIRDAVGAGR